MDTRKVADAWRIPDELWERMEPLLPRIRRSRKGGRPPVPFRQVMDGIFYVLRTGCQWKAVPPEHGSGSTLHRRFQEFVKRSVFRRLWRIGLMEYNELKGIQWEWQSIDGAMTKAPLGGGNTRPNPTDRAKLGTKRSLLTDGVGVPLGLAVSGANTHDKRLVKPTFKSMPIEWPKPTPNHRPLR